MIARQHSPKYTCTSRVTVKPVLDELMILHLETGTYYSLNPTATQIWNFCSEAITLEQITALLASCYEDVERETLARDVHVCVEQLLRENLLEFAKP
jgi:hypothetical protein